MRQLLRFTALVPWRSLMKVLRQPLMIRGAAPSQNRFARSTAFKNSYILLEFMQLMQRKRLKEEWSYRRSAHKQCERSVTIRYFWILFRCENHLNSFCHPFFSGVSYIILRVGNQQITLSLLQVSLDTYFLWNTYLIHNGRSKNIPRWWRSDALSLELLFLT